MARYHYNPETGKVGACRADPSKANSRGCRFALAESDHFGSPQEAAKAFEATQETLPAPASSSQAPAGSSSGRSLSAEQATFFQKSAVRDDSGKLLEVYHGSSKDFDSFDSDLVGRGNDSWGNGFYFTTQEETARSYSNGKGAKEFYLAVENPLRVDGREHMGLSELELTPAQTREIVLAHPDLQIQPDEMEERSNPLADYSPEFWDRDHHSPAQLKAMAEKLYRDYFSSASWVELESLYGRDYGQRFLHSVSKATGHDGVEVNFGAEDGKFFVAWFPEQIKLSSNGKPTDSAQFAG